MNDLVRPSSHLTSAIAASAPSGVLATIPNPPPDIARLPAGTTLRGVVVGNDGHGHVLVKTDLGTLAVATRATLAKDSEVVLQIRSSGAQLHIMIMQARGRGAAPPAPTTPPPTPPPGQSPAQSPGQTPGPGGSAPQAAGHRPGATGTPPAPASPAAAHGGGAASAAGQADPLNLGQIVRAVVQGPADPLQVRAAPAGEPRGAPATGLPGALPRFAPGTVLPLRILSVTAPGGIQGGVASVPAPAAPGTAAAGPRGPGPQGSRGPLTLASGPAAAVALLSGGPATGGAPGGPAGGPASNPASGPLGAGNLASGVPLAFNGQVTSVTHAGHPVLSTPLGTLTLEVEARLPGGTRLALELSRNDLPKGAEAPARLAGPGALGHAWPALEEALTVLRDPGAGPAPGTAQAGREGMPPGVPQPGPRLASGMLFFLAALSGGDLGRWLGAEALQSLRAAGRGSLLDRLAGDLARMGRMAEGAGGAGGGAGGGDWRLLPIPLWDGEHLRQLRLFLRQHEKDRDDAGKRDRRDPTRFVLELEMSRMGEMQLDGLVRERRFDLVMRSRAALPEAMRRDIRQIFEDANQAAGYSGNLGFQASADWRFLPIGQDASSGDPPGLVV